jgi:hypothetical protein
MRRTGLLLALALCGCAKSDKAPSPEPSPEQLHKLTVDEVEARINAHDGKTFVFDDNNKNSWIKAHVPTATWLDDEHVTADALPGDKAATLIFYCHNET